MPVPDLAAAVDAFIADLAEYEHSAIVINPYREAHLAENLRLYLMAMLRRRGRHVLLVGEAPGYRGCGLTGIPFSSGEIYQRFDHPLLRRLARHIEIRQVESENTATMVWEYLEDKPLTPLFWNSFPFHPHNPGDPRSNRAPNAREIEFGIHFLRRLKDLYRPSVIAGIGNKGTLCARRAFPHKSIAAIRHPSFGGKADFVRGMDQLFKWE